MPSPGPRGGIGSYRGADETRPVRGARSRGARRTPRPSGWPPRSPTSRGRSLSDRHGAQERRPAPPQPSLIASSMWSTSKLTTPISITRDASDGEARNRTRCEPGQSCRAARVAPQHRRTRSRRRGGEPRLPLVACEHLELCSGQPDRVREVGRRCPRAITSGVVSAAVASGRSRPARGRRWSSGRRSRDVAGIHPGPLGDGVEGQTQLTVSMSGTARRVTHRDAFSCLGHPFLLGLPERLRRRARCSPVRQTAEFWLQLRHTSRAAGRHAGRGETAPSGARGWPRR